MSPPVELVAVIGSDGTVLLWTDTAAGLWGRPAAEVVDHRADRLLMPGGARDRALRASRAWSGRVELRDGDGAARPVELRVTPLPARGGAGGGLVWEARRDEPAAPAEPDTGLLRRFFERSPVGAALWDRDLRCTWHNDALVAEESLPGGPWRGQHITELMPGAPGDDLAATMRRVLESEDVPRGWEWVRPRVPGAGKDSLTLTLALIRLDDTAGRAMGVCMTVADSADSAGSRLGQRFNLLVRAGTRIGTTLDLKTTAQELVDTAVPGLADYATVDLTDSVMLGEMPLGRLDSTEASIPVFYRAGVASIRPGSPESPWPRGTQVFAHPSSPFTGVLASGRSYLEPVLDTSPGTWVEADPERARVIRDYGLHSMMIAPLSARGKVLGIAVFGRTTNPAPFSEEDLALAEGLAARASLSLDNARRYSRERAAALALQRDLLPHILSGGRAVEVASRYLPADTHGGVGGDWFDVIPMARDRVALVVGDVVGHGIAAAATMGRLRMVLNTLANLELPPDQVLMRLDELVVGLARDRPEEELASPSVGATCVYVVYDPVGQCCTMASAGHPPPALVTPDGRVAFADVPPGAPIGVGRRDFPSVEVPVPEGSLIALYTDGLVETREADIDHGLDRLRAALTRPVTTLDRLCADVTDAMLADEHPEDDIALLIARTLSVAPGP
ncbi:SpoIIE family protein phosphatase [Streptomyces sp. NBC_01190]|uniref:SpoIIE family protein phosphatase n=1 Tax=Streptomyces sp. NBC_01190 TaxID=2903767 RepID=UPI0038637FB3|nr:SpoIIE family protein phosphatase [Streptomyces sp. NBC_01190]